MSTNSVAESGQAVERVDAFIQKAMGWMDVHLEEFDPFSAGQPFEIRLGQRVGEFAILLHSYVALTGRAGDRVTLRMSETLARIQRNPEFAARLIRSPLEFILFAEVYANLRAVGRDDPQAHALIQRVLDAGFLEQTERFPNRMMDIRACLDMGGFASDYPQLPALYERSILAARIDPLLLSQDDLYAITHVLMFLYGFGTRRDYSVPDHSLADLQSLLSGLIVLVAQERHWDLMAELLICWECVGLAPSEISERAWAELEKLQDSDGAIPGPEWAARLHAELSEPADRDTYFSHHYHTTLVSVIAACLRSRRLKERATRSRPRTTTAGKERQRHVDRRLETAHTARSWLRSVTGDMLSDPDTQAGPLAQLIIGNWATAALANDSLETVAPEIQRIGHALAERDAANKLSWWDMPAAHSLLVAIALERYEIVVPYLHASCGFLARAVQTLEVMDDPALNDPRTVLENAGRLTESPRPSAREVVAVADGLSIAADPEDIDVLADLVEAHTAFGTRPSLLRPRDGWIAELLAGVAIQSLRRYDLVRGARLIRALRALEPLSTTSLDLLRHCLSFIYLNQEPGGAFGFLAPEARALAEVEPGRDAECAIALPATVECLWALAEAETGWRLFGMVESL
jgi:hypothetical protein